MISHFEAWFATLLYAEQHRHLRPNCISNYQDAFGGATSVALKLSHAIRHCLRCEFTATRRAIRDLLKKFALSLSIRTRAGVD